MLNAILVTFFVAMVPVIELRGAIPIGVGMGLPPLLAAALAIFGNLVPIPFILLLLKYVFDFLRPKKYTHRLISWLEQKAEKNRKTINKYGWLGLIILVAIPLPGTGAWTGALVASCFQMQKKQAFFAIAIGVLIAAAIVLALTYGVSGLLTSEN